MRKPASPTTDRAAAPGGRESRDRVGKKKCAKLARASADDEAAAAADGRGGRESRNGVGKKKCAKKLAGASADAAAADGRGGREGGRAGGRDRRRRRRREGGSHVTASGKRNAQKLARASADDEAAVADGGGRGRKPRDRRGKGLARRCEMSRSSPREGGGTWMGMREQGENRESDTDKEQNRWRMHVRPILRSNTVASTAMGPEAMNRFTDVNRRCMGCLLRVIVISWKQSKFLNRNTDVERLCRGCCSQVGLSEKELNFDGDASEVFNRVTDVESQVGSTAMASKFLNRNTDVERLCRGCCSQVGLSEKELNFDGDGFRSLQPCHGRREVRQLEVSPSWAETPSPRTTGTLAAHRLSCRECPLRGAAYLSCVGEGRTPAHEGLDRPHQARKSKPTRRQSDAPPVQPARAS
ncbi:hypothetical protein B0H11DRAFT_1929768 [Mycena galericulata]|nr:hypothetical protein B0H11DRAFT_1929768 [Mycena galericulata]